MEADAGLRLILRLILPDLPGLECRAWGRGNGKWRASHGGTP
jgi:hypothetical protein